MADLGVKIAKRDITWFSRDAGWDYYSSTAFKGTIEVIRSLMACYLSKISKKVTVKALLSLPFF